MVLRLLSNGETGNQVGPGQGIAVSCTDGIRETDALMGEGTQDIVVTRAAEPQHLVPSPSLVRREHNSVKCDRGIWLRRTCKEHGTERIIQVPCKRRDCETCGPLGRYRIAQRIAWGVRVLGVDRCAWLVLTFERDVTKKEAVRRLATFIRFLRVGHPDLEYAATYELQESGRLHINLIVGPWAWDDQVTLQDKWGARLWIAWVREESDVANEMAKNYSPESLGNYLAKLDQSVPTDRRVSFSRGFPKRPVDGGPGFEYERLTDDEVRLLWYAREQGYMVEVEPGVWAKWDDVWGKEACECVKPAVPPPRLHGN